MLKKYWEIWGFYQHFKQCLGFARQDWQESERPDRPTKLKSLLTEESYWARCRLQPSERASLAKTMHDLRQKISI